MDEKPPETTCALCGKPAILQISHIIPAFVFRWFRETSVTGHMRFGSNPKRRVQDGLKRPLLCIVCEGRLNRWETSFANEIFYPYNADSTHVARYGDWLLKFCVSVSWRALRFIIDETKLKGWSDVQIAGAHQALERWRAVMFGECQHPGRFEQHILPLEKIESTTTSNLPKNINRYIMRSIEINAARGERSAFIYSKMGRFAIFGIIEPMQNQWKGSRVAVKGGLIKPSKYILPYEVMDYIKDRAQILATLTADIPDHQIDRIEDKWMQELERAIATDEFSAVLADERMFGMDAILRKKKPDNV